MTQLRESSTWKKNPNAPLKATSVMLALEADGKCNGGAFMGPGPASYL